VLVLGQPDALAVVDEIVLRHLGRALARDDEAARIGVDDRRDALEDVAVLALVDPLLLAGLDRDPVDERLRPGLLRVLVVGRALEEDALLVRRQQDDAAARAAEAAAASATTTAAAAADRRKRARVAIDVIGAIARQRVALRGIRERDRVFDRVLAGAFAEEN